MWYQCPVCGMRMQGDPRYPPICPNMANHPMPPFGQHPPRRPNAWQRLQARNRRQLRGINMSAVLAFFGAFICLAIIVRIILAFTAPAINSQASQPTATLTPEGSPTLEGATLGGTLDAFKARFGSPKYSKGSVYQFFVTGSDGSSIIVSLQLKPGNDNQGHVNFMTIEPQSNTTAAVSMTTLESTAKQFLPDDALFTQDKPFFGSELNHLYRSAKLAATFPATAFTEAGGTPGTFWLRCNNASEVWMEECMIDVGGV